MGSRVTAILDELGIQYRLSGDEANAACPNPHHEDHRPSWYINTETGDHICFSCGWAGPLSRLVEALRSVDREEAEHWVRARHFIVSESLSGPFNFDDPEPVKTSPVTDADLWAFTAPPSRELRKRGISSDSAGELGILWDDDERAWILPFRDADGTLHGWQSKSARGKLVRNYPEGIKKSHFLFGLHASASDQCVLVESPLDVAVLRDAGIKGGAASYGVHVSRVQLSLLTEHYSSVILALDNDNAGWRESEKLRKEFHALPVRFFDYFDSRAKDVGEMTPEEIRRGAENASLAMMTRF